MEVVRDFKRSLLLLDVVFVVLLIPLVLPLLIFPYFCNLTINR